MRWPSSAPACATARMSRLCATDWRLATASTQSFCTSRRTAAICWRTSASSTALMPGLSHWASSCSARRWATASVNAPASGCAGASCKGGRFFCSQRSTSAWPRGNCATARLASCQLRAGWPAVADGTGLGPAGNGAPCTCAAAGAAALGACAQTAGPRPATSAAPKAQGPKARFKRGFMSIS